MSVNGLEQGELRKASRKDTLYYDNQNNQNS